MDVPTRDTLASILVPPRRGPLAGAVALALAGGLVLTALLFAGARQLEQDKLDLAFQQRAHLRVMALDAGIANALDTLRAVNQLFASEPQVTREQFERYSTPLLARAPYIHGVSYLRFVSQAERAAEEAGLSRVAPGTFLTEMYAGRPVPAGVRARYLVVEYIEPYASNRRALGLNTTYPNYDGVSRQRAYDSGQPQAGIVIPLAQGEAAPGASALPGVVISMPVYRYGAPLADVAARRAALVGETAIVLRPADLVQNILAGNGLLSRGSMDLRVYAAATEAAGALVYQASAERDGRPAGMLPWPRSLRWLYPAAPARSARQVAPLDVAGQPWLVVATPAPQWRGSDHLASLCALALGLILTALATALARSISTRTRDIQRHVDLRTRQLKELNQTLLLRERAMASSTNAIVITLAAQHNATVYVNPAFERISGYSAAEMLGQSPRLLYGSDIEQQGVHEIRAAIREQRDGHAVLRNYRKDGTLFWNDVYISPVRDEDGAVTHYVSIQHDITAMKAYENELQHQSTHDALTGLPNRVLMHDRLQQAITHAARKGHAVWVVSIDLDRFKFTNSRLGHKGGDRLLQAVAERLQVSVRPTDTVARIGGDEFALLLLPEHGAGRPSPHQVQRLLDDIAAPLTLDGQQLFLTCSAGVAVYPDDGSDPDALAERADIAMYRAKEMGRNNFQFYTAAMNEQLGERVLIEGALRGALERGEFVLHYQPQVDITSGRIVGMEALIRWLHPELGLVAPNRFIGLAEETGLILPIGAWVMRTACEQLLAWQRAGRGELRMAVNVSARQIAEQDFVQSVAALLTEIGLTPACLELELTETLVMNDLEHAIVVMHELKKLGVKLAIDDFGTGYSSLAHLKRFEVDVLKIDQTFVRDLTIDPDDAAIVATIIALAANLNLNVISEGVETLEQVAFLREHGCRQMQGYYFSRPVDAAAFEALLLENEASTAQRDAGREV
ncbi:EAL domain-containing protein [Rugamonas sp.]|uniref:bifunctional diguanylate cyclase/phosphodiesterase n=1 Tax=Rugamonas sp. TaxID=1926287 RepID=UPI0025EA1E05|nr:EAL domain-containing protein [Rugamonas sp.]